MTVTLDEQFGYLIIISLSLVAILWGIINWFNVKAVTLSTNNILTEDSGKSMITQENLNKMVETTEAIQKGAQTFLIAEFIYLAFFVVVFSVILVWIDEGKPWTAIAFVIGSLTSIVSGYIGMHVGTRTNARVTLMAGTGVSTEQSLSRAFVVAYRGGCVMGFILVGLALLVLGALLYTYKVYVVEDASFMELFEYIAGYGLGGSSVALFCRVGGGIYTKAADVGADLVGKVLMGFAEDDPRNPATIADNVGDNVGDIAGMGADLFGSLAESTCAALVVSATSTELVEGGNYLFPIFLSSVCILPCVATSFVATNLASVTKTDKVEAALKNQLIISTLLLTPTIYFSCILFLPETFVVGGIQSSNFKIMVCCLSGLFSGLLIGFLTDYYTSNSHSPVEKLAQSCKSGSAINIINGLALGYKSCIIPIIAIAVTIYISFEYAGMYGISIAALGILSNLTVGLAIDAYGPISDNAGGISEMSECHESVRDITDALDAAGNTTAAIGKGFAIGSACLVSLALYGAFITRIGQDTVNILKPIEFAGLIIGAMIPYAFSAFTMASVGEAAAEMCTEVKQQVFKDIIDSDRCVRISTNASLKEMIIPGVMVIATPLVLGFCFGPNCVSGYLAGVIVSGVQMAISSSNSGGAWDNAKKYIEARQLRILEEDMETFKNDPTFSCEAGVFLKGSEPHKAAVVGDTVGDPLKDTSGPSLNILIKLSAIVSLVFGSSFSRVNLLGFNKPTN